MILDKTDFIITLPWDNNAVSLRLKDKNNNILASEFLSNIESIDNTPNFKSVVGSQVLNKYSPVRKVSGGGIESTDGFFDITLIGANFPDQQALDWYYKDVQMYITHILRIIPFNIRASQIRFHRIDNTTNLNCYRPSFCQRCTYCDWDLISQIVNQSGSPWDVIFTVFKDAEYGGVAYPEVNIGVASDQYDDTNQYDYIYGVIRGPGYNWTPEAFVHEFGHLYNAGYLMDEYPYGSNTGMVARDNCYDGRPLNSAWVNLVGIQDYYLECTDTAYYQSSEKSIMGNLEVEYFNTVSNNLINQSLDEKAGVVTPPINLPDVVIKNIMDNQIVSGDFIVNTNLISLNSIVHHLEFWLNNNFLFTRYPADYRFGFGSNITLAWNTRSVPDGQHTIIIKAKDGFNTAGINATKSVWVKNNPDTNFTPIGNFDSIDTNGLAIGWAVDVDPLPQSISVKYYITTPGGQPQLAGTEIAQIPRSDVNQMGYAGNHGFSWSIPQFYRNGMTHSLRVYAVDSQNGRETLLSGSPKSFTLSAPTPTLTPTNIPVPTRIPTPTEAKQYPTPTPATYYYMGNYQEDCVTTCNRYQKTCISTNWNDDTNCTMLKAKNNNCPGGCFQSTLWSAPYINSNNQCYYRSSSVNQNCSGKKDGTRRLCACR